MYKFFFFFLVIFFLPGCNDTFYSSIPNAPVNFICSLAQSPYVIITTTNQFFTVQKTSSGFSGINTAGQKISGNKYGFYFGYGGILVGNSAFNGYCAFDWACPYEYKEYNKKVSVELQTDGIGTAICPVCQTKYDLNNGGIPKEGDSKERLKPYKVTLFMENGVENIAVSN